MLSLDMVERAKSGHPGLPLGAAAVAYILWTRVLKYNPLNPLWPDRDRFVLSAGHGSALLYTMLHLTGYEKMTMDELRNFRQWGSLTPGHPEACPEAGVEVTTGPLGQGVANAVGLAIAERHLAARFNRPGFEIIDHFTYALCGDGDLMEGVASEAASIAGHLKLGKLVCIYDNNHVSLAGETRLTFTEDVGARFSSYGWHVRHVKDGNDITAIEDAILAAHNEVERPSLIITDTHIGYGSPHKQDSFEAHGSPLGKEETAATRRNLGWPGDKDFYVPEEALAHFRTAVTRGERLESDWKDVMESCGKEHAGLMEEWEACIEGRLPSGWDSRLPAYLPEDKDRATRSAGGDVINALAESVPNIIGGSADLDPSTKTALKGMGSFQPPGSGDDAVQGSPKGEWGYGSPNIAFGVREHAMGGIMNGMAAHGGLIPFGSTFLIFSDYMRPAMRIAALSGLRVIYVFTHDSVAVGEDGPTHQPVEQLSGLRAMPGITVIRPADASETVEAWKAAVTRKAGPVALVFSRQKLPVIDRGRYAPADMLQRGGYVLAEPSKDRPELILIATGSEVHAALAASRELTRRGVRVRVVNMPSWELFEEQPQSYRDEVLPPEVTRRMSVEAAATHGWSKYIGPDGMSVGIDRFGASAPGSVNMEKFGFTPDDIVDSALELMKK